MDASPSAAPPGGRKIVLVVEDNVALRNVVKRQLDDIGYKVLEAKDADDALELLGNGGGIDLLFTDIVMPGKTNGLELARLAIARWPALKVVLTSGFADTGATALPAALRFLGKPYLKQDLAKTFREVLDGVQP